MNGFNQTLDINEILVKYEDIVFFGGAGVSTESGIPDFRSSDGLYNQIYKYPPEEIVSRDFFMENTEEFYRFYFDKMVNLSALPNEAHKKLAELEQRSRISAVITQNIDGLHQRAGSENVLELHGSVLRNYCTRCGEFFDIYTLMERSKLSEDGVPRCRCGGVIKPDVVLYGEELDNDIIRSSIYALKNADLVIVGGTSLSVYPAASFLDYTKADIMLVNKTPTPYDRKAKYVFNEPIGKLFSKIKL